MDLKLDAAVWSIDIDMVALEDILQNLEGRLW
jgi:hypothetical protein